MVGLQAAKKREHRRQLFIESPFTQRLLRVLVVAGVGAIMGDGQPPFPCACQALNLQAVFIFLVQTRQVVWECGALPALFARLATMQQKRDGGSDCCPMRILHSPPSCGCALVACSGLPVP